MLNAAVPGRKWSDARWRRIRAIAGGLMAVLLAAFVFSGLRTARVISPGGWFVRLHRGTLAAGYYADWLPQIEPRWEFSMESDSYGDDGAAAWRPFHAGGAMWHYLVIPLWQPLLLCLGISAYAHGFLRGRENGDRDRCPNCGYDLFGLPISADRRRCPECGLESPIAPSRRSPTW